MWLNFKLQTILKIRIDFIQTEHACKRTNIKICRMPNIQICPLCTDALDQSTTMFCPTVQAQEWPKEIFRQGQHKVYFSTTQLICCLKYLRQQIN